MVVKLHICNFGIFKVFSIYLYWGIEDSLAKSSVPHYFITPQYVVWPSIENSYIPA